MAQTLHMMISGQSKMGGEKKGLVTEHAYIWDTAYYLNVCK